VLEQFGINKVENAAEVLPVVHLPEPSLTAEASTSVPSYLLVAREKRLSQLAPLVFEAAFKDKDPFALNVLKNTAEGLADQIAMLCREPGEDPSVKPRALEAKEAVLCFGGSLVGIEDYRALVNEALAKKGHVFKYVEFVDDAAAVGVVGLASLKIGLSGEA
jgi:N-acetylglucosamine kinase-like BadF-type ATPase